MLISKKKGEKLANKEMKVIYGGSCNCLPGCDCRKSNGENFFSPFDGHMTLWDSTYQGDN